jgi:peptidoglycan/xylan/chitin deacetylase (PgdA/CDA1 family)
LHNPFTCFLDYTPESWMHWMLGQACLLPYYHMVSDESLSHISSLYSYRNVARFKKDLDLLCKGRTPLNLEDFLAAIQRHGHPPENSFLLTFDDGFREMSDVVAPILSSRGIPAVFFLMSAMLDNRQLCFQQKISLLAHRTNTVTLTSATEIAAHNIFKRHGIVSSGLNEAIKAVPWTQRQLLDELAPVLGVDFTDFLHRTAPYLTTDQAAAMIRQGFSIGSHSVDHPRYRDIPLAEQVRQTRESMQHLASRLPIQIRTFAFPHTDSGVSQEFYRTVLGDGSVAATFGTSGPWIDSVAGSYQRFSMEKPDRIGTHLLTRHAFRRIKQRLTARPPIQRP